MPTFNIALAHDISHYGTVSVEADTWQDAVRTLDYDAWWESCNDADDSSWEERVVRVETEDGDIVAEDLRYGCEMVHHRSVIQRLREIQIAPGRVPCMVMDAAIDQYIAELEAMPRDPIFKKEQTND